jgi:CheY-like chemotaxis protein
MQSRILVVEDEHLQQSVLKAALAADGHKVENCSDGLAALRKIREGHYNLVLLDYQLPKIEGIATARLIGDLMGEIARPRLVALAALPDSMIGRELLAERAFDEVVSKSADLPELFANHQPPLRSAAAGAARQAPEFDLPIKEWDEFDVRRVASGGPAPTDGARPYPRGRGRRSAAQRPDGRPGDAGIRHRDRARWPRCRPEDARGQLRPRSDRLRGGCARVAFVTAPDHLASRAMSHRMFDAVVGKPESPPAVLAIVNGHLQGRP